MSKILVCNHLKTSLKEKMDVLEQLDKGILELMTEEDDFDKEIQMADDCREKIQLALIELDAVLKTCTVPQSDVAVGPRKVPTASLHIPFPY